MVTCAFCSILAGDTAADIVYRDDSVVAFLDRAPLFKGHVLVVPICHIETLPELPDALRDDFFGIVQRVAAALPGALDAHGTFVAINNVVSQSVPHVHAHVVPRRRKDGLRGFFWPRQKYVSTDEAARFADAVRHSLQMQ